MAHQSMSRETLLPLLGSYVLEHGLGSASLRPLARAAGTSDRMLLYHFGSKETLIREVLGYLAEQYADILDKLFNGKRPATRADCLSRIYAFSKQPEAAPYLTTWWEIVAGSARDLIGYRAAAQYVMQRMLEWLEQHMPENDPDPAGGARYLLTLIEGAQMMETIGRADIASAGIAVLRSRH